MEVINMSKKKFESLRPLILSDGVVNTEAVIYDFRYSSKFDGVLKKLNRVDGNVFGSKLYTLEMLDYYRAILPNCFVVPDCLVTVKNVVVGFAMPKIWGDNLSVILKNNNIGYKEQIYYLKCIGEILNKLENVRTYTELKDIFIGDLQECNFVVNPYTKDLFVIDLDSCKISNNISQSGRYLTRGALLNNASHKYTINYDESILAHVVPNKNSDLYCYIIMVLNYLYGSNINNVSLEYFYDYLNYLEYIGMNRELLDSFSNIVSYGDNVNICEYLDGITKENIFRAKKKVYEIVKGRK